MSTEFKINTIVEIGIHDNGFWVIRNIIGETAFVEYLCDGRGEMIRQPIAQAHPIKSLLPGTQALDKLIKQHNTRLFNLIAIKTKYTPSNEGSEKET